MLNNNLLHGASFRTDIDLKKVGFVAGIKTGYNYFYYWGPLQEENICSLNAKYGVTAPREC